MISKNFNRYISYVVFSVEALMKSIASTFMIPIEKQVLIMQGGDALDPSHRICNYSSAGTVSNTSLLLINNI